MISDSCMLICEDKNKNVASMSKFHEGHKQKRSSYDDNKRKSDGCVWDKHNLC